MILKDQLLIIGASGHGKVVADIAKNLGKYSEISFIDDDPTIKAALGYKVVGNCLSIKMFIYNYNIFVAIGDNQIRKKFIRQLEDMEASIPALIHPNAIIGEQVSIGLGTVVMAGTVITCDSLVGKGCIINTGATIDHDCNLGDYVHISPGVHIAGNVSIGKGTWVGIGATISNNVDICSNCIIGAGAVVVKDLIDEGIYVGIPARKIN